MIKVKVAFQYWINEIEMMKITHAKKIVDKVKSISVFRYTTYEAMLKAPAIHLALQRPSQHSNGALGVQSFQGEQ